MKNRMICLFSALALVSTALLATGCSSEQKRTDVTVIATGTQDGSRPFWTYDGKLDIEKLRKEMKDDADEPKLAYVISDAWVNKEEAIPNCYNMARTRGARDLSLQISENIKAAKALSESNDSTEFAGHVEAEAKNFLIGAEVMDRTWIKFEEKGDIKFHCWTVLGVPRERLKKLQDNVQAILDREASSDPALRSRVKDSLDKMVKNM